MKEQEDWNHSLGVKTGASEIDDPCAVIKEDKGLKPAMTTILSEIMESMFTMKRQKIPAEKYKLY